MIGIDWGDNFFKSISLTEQGHLIKARGFPIGTVREWKGRKYIKKGPNKWMPHGQTKEAGETKEGYAGVTMGNIPVKGLNKAIDFKANEAFLNDEIKGVQVEVESPVRVAAIEKAIAENEKDLGLKKKTLAVWVKVKKGNPLGDVGENLERTINSLSEAIEKQKKVLEKEKGMSGEQNLAEIEKFSQNLTPVHSLDIEKFLKVLGSGGLKALSELEEKGKQSGYAHIESRIRPLFGDEFSKLAYQYVDVAKAGSEDEDRIVSEMESVLKKMDISPYVTHDKLRELNEIKEEEQAGAIGYGVDKDLGTDKHIFSIMGPNGNGSGYGDVSIILKPEVMKHPDFNMTPTAGTSFVSGQMNNSRPWTKKDYKKEYDEIKKEEESLNDVTLSSVEILSRTKEIAKKLSKLEASRGFDDKGHFHKSKLNGEENPEYHKYMAKDIAAQGGVESYLKRESHGKWEAHLPPNVPTSMFAEIVITKRVMSVIGKEFLSFDDLGLPDPNKVMDALEKKYGKLPIKLVDRPEDILPYMNEGFKSGKWKAA